jgi:hypothetical protein
MVFDAIETLKSKYTDKFVQVDGQTPELRRFAGLTGRVKTVNMSGRALVEFDLHNNIGWYDIALDFLRIVAAPAPQMQPAAAPEKVEPKPAAKKPVAGAGASVADILATARAEKSAGAPSEVTPKREAKPARETDQPAGELAAKKMSTAAILAAARAKKAGGAGAPGANADKLIPISRSRRIARVTDTTEKNDCAGESSYRQRAW